MSVRRKALPADAALRVQTSVPQPFNGTYGNPEKQPPQRLLAESPTVASAERFLAQKSADLSLNPPPAYNEVDNSQAQHYRFAQKEFFHSPTTLDPSPQAEFNDGHFGAPPETTQATKDFMRSPVEIDAPSQNDFNHPTSAPESSASTAQKSDRKAKVVSALQDASHFLGGLIKHPTESTKHFTVLRHSHGLVYYKGPMTSIAITVFADQLLPTNRRYWFQMKGWTGNTGMRAKAFLRTNGSWINVTPINRATSDELAPADEKAWQRDIKKFLDKRPKNLAKHTVRETAVIRVPPEATDGYFRIVLTGADDRSTLCPSPVFRVASTSMSAGSMKGASLSTLPLELSINILQFAANTMATNAVAPLATTAKDQVSSILPSAVASHGQAAYSLSGAEGEIDNLNQQYSDKVGNILAEARESDGHYISLDREDVVGDDSGPDKPFPVRLDSTIVPGTGKGLREVGMPTANLGYIPADTVATMNGVYFGWALVTPEDKSLAEIHSEWRHAIISVTYDDSVASVAAKKTVRAYLLHSFGGETFYGAKISVVVMGFLRPTISRHQKEAFFSETMRDIEISRLSLEREQWGPEPTLTRIKTAKSERSFSERYVDGRMAVQRHVDKVPIHRLGVRTESSTMKDRGLYGNGGLFVVRDTM